MSARFFVLFPENQIEVAMASHMVNVLRQSLDQVWIGRLIQEPAKWISDGFMSFDETIVFEKTPGEKKSEILDHAPDYLLDLSGSGKFWLFKNRLRLVDFSLSGKSIRRIRSISELETKFQAYVEEVTTLISAFDPVSCEKLEWNLNTQETQMKYLPKSFLDGFVSVNLDDFAVGDQVFFDDLVSFLTILDYSTVLVGSEDNKELGDRVAKSVGCTIFNTAGDLPLNDMQGIYVSGQAIVGTGNKSMELAFITQKPFIDYIEPIKAEELRKHIKKSHG